ncbi:MAG: extracellular solute-binding protein [Lachnospiraceae bacterium]|nr:extracellular solute-binding protein [Lachnospiraceae bacterium]
MMKNMWLKKKAGRVLGILMAAVMTAATVPAAAPTSHAAYQSDQIDYEALLDIVQDSDSYGSYLSSHAGAAYPDAQIIVYGGDFADASEGFARLEDYAELGNACALTLEEGSITYEVAVEQAGFYNLRLVYYPVEGKNNEIGRSVSVNGEIPYDEAQYFEFTRIWQNADEIVRDARDNDVRPKQEEAPSWISVYCKDSEGFYQDAMYFYLEKGVNTITFDSTQEPMIIGQLVLEQEERPISYAEYQSANARAGYTQVSVEPIKIQAEDASYKSNSTLYPITDRSSPLTEPQNAAKTRLNTVGGSNWSLNGQWITWNVEVPEDGLYEIALKYRQNKNQGVTVVRALYLDGEIPFAEASQLQFYYNNSWKITALGNGEESYQFYLSKGTHTLTLMVGLDEELAEILRLTDECVTQLNAAYRQLLMVIGTSPDTMRDYQLELKVPEALSILEEQYALVRVLEEKIKSYSRGSKGSQTATIQNLANQLRLMTENPKRIAKQWSAFKENIVALSSWELSMKEQPLEIDYLLVEEPGEKLPKVNAGFISSLIFEIKKFAASFVEDYDSIGNVYGGETLEVWILADSTAITSQSGGGRDQAIVIKDLVDNYFVPETGIAVNVKLVNKDVLLSATLAGEGPDVALNVAGKEPVNYALRNAAVDLTQFDDYEEVASWFYHDALTQFTYNGGVYALPQTMSFHVLFYRADILTELGIGIPRTWDEFYEALAVIQKSNMNVGILPDYTSYAMFLYQYGGDYYAADDTACALDSEEAIAAFKQWSGNYSNYKMPITYDFANRFRTGEMPLAIGDYTNYNYLSVFAPEIKGMWGFTVVPGYEKENGETDHSVSAWETASIIMATSDKQAQGWEFLKWWMSADTQTDYGNEIENVLGVAGRVATANLEALGNLPWSSADYRQLSAQLEWVKAIPEIPGSYYLERNIKNAFYTVYDDNEDPREVLQDTVITINDEITSKRREFGLTTR